MEMSEHTTTSHKSEHHDAHHDVPMNEQPLPHNRPPRELLLRETIVGPAWELVMTTSFLKKFNFFPSLLSTIYLGCIILYQLAFSYVYIFKLKDQFFAIIIDWVHTSYFWQFASALIIGILLYILITPIAE